MQAPKGEPPIPPPQTEPPYRPNRSALVAQTILAGAAVLLILGAYGSWGALSAVDEQAEIVASTRHGLAVAGTLVFLSAATPRFRPQLAGFAIVVLAVAGIVNYGDWTYEETQAFRYDAEASRWGLVTIFVGCAIGILAAISEIAFRLGEVRRIG